MTKNKDTSLDKTNVVKITHHLFVVAKTKFRRGTN